MKDFKAVVMRPRKIALYASMTLNDFYPLGEVEYVDYDEHFERLPEGQLREVPRYESVRISEPIEISFKPVDNDSVVQNAVNALNEQERRAIDELNKKLAEIRERKNQLLALTHQPERV